MQLVQDNIRTKNIIMIAGEAGKGSITLTIRNTINMTTKEVTSHTRNHIRINHTKINSIMTTNHIIKKVNKSIKNMVNINLITRERTLNPNIIHPIKSLITSQDIKILTINTSKAQTMKLKNIMKVHRKRTIKD